MKREFGQEQRNRGGGGVRGLHFRKFVRITSVVRRQPARHPLPYLLSGKRRGLSPPSLSPYARVRLILWEKQREAAVWPKRRSLVKGSIRNVKVPRGGRSGGEKGKRQFSRDSFPASTNPPTIRAPLDGADTPLAPAGRFHPEAGGFLSLRATMKSRSTPSCILTTR